MVNTLQTYLENAPFKTLNPALDKVVLTHKEQKVQSLEEFLPAPLTLKKSIKFDDLRGFIEYANDFKNKDSICFASRAQLRIIFDGSAPEHPSWENHVITYDIQPSQRWKIWERAHNEWMSQKEFAEFLDTGLNEITNPTQSAILDLVKNFRATVNQELVSEDNSSGSKFTFSKEVRGMAKKQDIEIPEYLQITLQPFDNLHVINQNKKLVEKIPAYNLRAKINWRVVDMGGLNHLQFKIQILNFETAVEDTLESIRNAVGSLTSIKTYIG